MVKLQIILSQKLAFNRYLPKKLQSFIDLAAVH